MTIPNVTMRWCVKKSTCRWCDQSIDNGTPVVTVFFWNKGEDSGKWNRKWNVRFSYHPQCWVDQGLDYLNRNPYIPQHREKKPTLCEEDRRKRFLLVRKFHKAEQMRKNSGSYPDNLLAEVRLTEQMIGIMLEVAVLGGVPKSWAERL